jgi:hypothetical protein
MKQLFQKGYKPNNKKCTHILNQDTPNSVSSDVSVVSATHDISISDKHKCNSIALNGYDYCRWHIKHHAEQYTAFCNDNAERVGKLKGKYQFANADIRKAYNDKVGQGGKLLDLREDIALLTMLLERLINAKGTDNSKDIIKIIDLQRKCIVALNDIRKANIKAFTQDKLETLIDRLTNIIKTNIEQPETRQKIAIEFVQVSKEYAEQTE